MMLSVHLSVRRLPIHAQRRQLNRACGLVGCPNVGKSTTFNALVGSAMAAAENFPFCTVDPNVCKVPIEDSVLAKMGAKEGARAVVPSSIEVRDIAGLVKGASEGAGMGNQFLSEIRSVAVVLQVVRCFKDDAVTGVVSPISEFDDINQELILSDIELAKKRAAQIRKKAANDESCERAVKHLDPILKSLEGGVAARAYLDTLDSEEQKDASAFTVSLISAKPRIVLCNVEEMNAGTGNDLSQALGEHLKGLGISSLPFSARLEAEASLLASEDPEFLLELLESYSLDRRAVHGVLEECQRLLQLTKYYTVGEVEAKAWFVPNTDLKAPDAAAAIHSDFKKLFKGVEVWKAADVIEHGKQECRKKHLVKKGGKDYVVKEQDVLEFDIKGQK
mmetsp:Transcript_19853/g.48694  ORF Transcript_19853/g.48694 Transcript_19853/m.48694 type:complete len:391 (-) Transcript_19853:169-1341(-)